MQKPPEGLLLNCPLDGGAYEELGELTQQIMGRLGLRATCTASVANRKLNVWSGGGTPVVQRRVSVTFPGPQIFGAS